MKSPLLLATTLTVLLVTPTACGTSDPTADGAAPPTTGEVVTPTTEPDELESVLGPEEADTLMAHLPPTTWRDIATKDDLRMLETSMRSEISHAMERHIRWMVTYNTALAALALTAARLLF